MKRLPFFVACFSASLLLANSLAFAEPIADPDKKAAAPPPPKPATSDFNFQPLAPIPSVDAESKSPLTFDGSSPKPKPELIAPPAAQRDRIGDLQNAFDNPPVGSTPAPAEPVRPSSELIVPPAGTGGEFSIPGSTNTPPSSPVNPIKPSGGSEFTIPPTGDLGSPLPATPLAEPPFSAEMKPPESATPKTSDPAPVTPLPSPDFRPAGNATPAAPLLNLGDPITPLGATEPMPLNPAATPPASTPVAEPIDAPAPEPLDREPRELDPPSDPQPAPAYQGSENSRGPSRLWMDSSGRFTLNAAMISISKDNEVKLRDTEGEFWDIPVTRLCRKDQGYVDAQEHRNDVTDMRDWSNGLRAKFIRQGASTSRAMMKTVNGTTVMVYVDSLSPFDQGVFEALLSLGK